MSMKITHISSRCSFSRRGDQQPTASPEPRELVTTGVVHPQRRAHDNANSTRNAHVWCVSPLGHRTYRLYGHGSGRPWFRTSVPFTGRLRISTADILMEAGETKEGPCRKHSLMSMKRCWSGLE